jgi:clan AA aspartic protease (TIGR02281 family)
MKRFILLLTISLTAFAASAQNYDKIKNLLVLSKFEDAKTELEKNWTNAKFIAKPEAYLLKATIYAGYAMTEGKKNTPEAEQMIATADEAYAKYKSMEPELGLTSDLVYQNSHVNLYSYYYTAGYQDYSTNKWAPALAKLKKAVVYSDILMSRKLLNSVLDTNVLILAGITAEKSSDMEAAMTYYKRLADAKVSGDGFEGVYRFLVSHCFGNHDMAGFEKYKAIGKELFPKSDYFNYDKIDFAVGLTDNFNEKLAALIDVLNTDPTNQKANQVLGEIIYDTLNPKDEGAVLPTNFAELEAKMIEAFSKSAKGKPGYEIPFLYIGDHFINKASKVGERRDAHAKEMRARTKPGTMSSKEDVAKRDALDSEYSETLGRARFPYEKACAILAQKENLDMRDKQQFKKAASYLSDIYANKKVNTKSKPTEQAKYSAEEKKWNEIYENINGNNKIEYSLVSDDKIVPDPFYLNLKDVKITNAVSYESGIKMTKNGNVYEVPCYINGIKMKFIFDSGASDVSISLTEARFMLKNGYLNADDITSKQNYTIANGDIQEGYIINIRELKIGQYTLKNVKGSIVSTLNAPLLLGMSAIEKLGLKFDPTSGMLFK